MRGEINSAEEEKGSKVSHCLQYFTAGYHNAWGRADLKRAEKSMRVLLQGQRGHYSDLKLAILGSFKRRL